MKSTEAVNPRLLVAKMAMRASSHDRVARILHVFVLHAPCEVSAPHDSDAFYMQVHERMSTIPRGQLCLLLGDFNARVGSIAADCFGRHAPVTENQNGERMRELLTGNNTFFPSDPYTWTKVAGRPAILDYVCASSELPAATRWAGVRKDIDVRVGSAEDHWPVVADVHLSIGEPRENRRKQSASIDRNLVHDLQRVLIFQNRLEHVVLRDELEIEPLCNALTAEVANAAIDCFRKCHDVPRKDWISGHSWSLIKWAQSLRTDLRNARANVNGMRLAVAFNGWRCIATGDRDTSEWTRAANRSGTEAA